MFVLGWYREQCEEPPMSEELKRALESIKGHRMTADERDAQRISFVYGNASAEDQGTKESVRRALDLAEYA